MPKHVKLNEKELQAKAALFFKDNKGDKVVFVSEDGFCFKAANKLQAQNYVNGKKLELIEIKAKVSTKKK